MVIKGVTLGQELHCTLSGAPPHFHFPLPRETAYLLGNFLLRNSHHLPIRIAGFTRDVKMSFWGQESPDSWDAGNWINHFPSHKHLSHEFDFHCDRQPNLGSVSYPPIRFLKVYIEVLPGFSHVYHPNGLNNTLLSQRYIFETAPGVGLVSRIYIPRTRGQGWWGAFDDPGPAHGPISNHVLFVTSSSGGSSTVS